MRAGSSGRAAKCSGAEKSQPAYEIPRGRYHAGMMVPLHHVRIKTISAIHPRRVYDGRLDCVRLAVLLAKVPGTASNNSEPAWSGIVLGYTRSPVKSL